MTSLRGLSVLVSGATGGLGTPISRRLALEGAQLTLLGRDIRGLEALDLEASLVTGDLRDPETAVRAAAAAVAEYGRLDGLVVASGVVAFGPVGDLPDEALVDLFLVNTLAPIRLLRAVLPHLAGSARDGRSPFVVHLSAVVAEHPTAGYWAFLHRNRERLATNPRMGQSLSGLDRLSDLDAVLEQEADRGSACP